MGQPERSTFAGDAHRRLADARGYLMLVEDNPGDARLTTVLLDDQAGSWLPPLRWVQTVDAALRLLHDDPHCEAVLLDLGLPDSQGLQGLQALAAADAQLPIVVLTGNDRSPLGLDAVAGGAQDFLVKGQFDGAGLQRCIGFARRRKQLEAQLLERALHDVLTGLPGRALLQERLRRAMAQAAQDGTAGALLYIDLDGFKAVNDAHGHAAGDRLLKTIARRLREAVRASDTAARLGGDEFVVLLPDAGGEAEALAVAAKLLQAVQAPVPSAGGALAVSVSIGVALFRGGADGPQALLQRADAAMYAAKAAGKGRVHVL